MFPAFNPNQQPAAAKPQGYQEYSLSDRAAPQVVPPGGVVVGSDEEEENLTRCAKIGLALSIIPPIGCGNFVYHRYMKDAQPETFRSQLALYSLYLSSIVALIIVLGIFWSLLKWAFWLVIVLCVCIVIGIIISPRFRAWFLDKTSSLQGSEDANAAPANGQPAAAPNSNLGSLAFNYAMNNPQQVANAAKNSKV